MRNDKFFTYIEKHPVAKLFLIIVLIGGYLWELCAICVLPAVIELSDTYGLGPTLLWLVMFATPFIISSIIDHIFKERYRGELITDYFSVYRNDGGFQVTVNERRVEEFIIKKKKHIPYFIKESLKNVYLIKLYRLPDGKNIYIHREDDEMVIFLNDTIIMEHDRIYYDRIDKIYGVKQVSPVVQQVNRAIQQNVQMPVNESIGRTTPVMEQSNKDTYKLIALEGQFAGQSWELDKSVMLGRDANCCQVVFAPDTAGISRVHCEVGCKNGSLYIRDLGSSYGTTLENGQVVNNYQEVRLESSNTFRLNLNDKFMVMK